MSFRKSVRKALGLEVGAQFVVMGDGDTVVLKRIAAPAKSELRAMIGKVRSQARRAGIKPSDVGRGGSPRPPRALKLSWTPDPRAAIRVASACPSILLSARWASPATPEWRNGGPQGT